METLRSFGLGKSTGSWEGNWELSKKEPPYAGRQKGECIDDFGKV
jgi:hypothetical protein